MFGALQKWLIVISKEWSSTFGISSGTRSSEDTVEQGCMKAIPVVPGLNQLCEIRQLTWLLCVIVYLCVWLVLFLICKTYLLHRVVIRIQQIPIFKLLLQCQGHSKCSLLANVSLLSIFKFKLHLLGTS